MSSECVTFDLPEWFCEFLSTTPSLNVNLSFTPVHYCSC